MAPKLMDGRRSMHGEGDPFSEIKSVGLMEFNGSRKKDKEFSDHLDKQIKDGKLDLDKKFVMKQLERGSSPR